MILINTLGIQDSGGITVLVKLLDECMHDKSNNYLIVCGDNKNIKILHKKYQDIKYFIFKFFNAESLLNRLYIENVIFIRLIRVHRVNLIYNFSGSAQFFLKIPQLAKLHDLSFFSKKTDDAYFSKGQYFKWLKQVFFKRLIFRSMINRSDYIETQSSHVQSYVENFVNISSKPLFVKSDINVDKSSFQTPKKIDFAKTVKFFYIVGPHFESIHKNFEVFVRAMTDLKEEDFDFEIIITLTKEQLYSSNLWNRSLDICTNFLGYASQQELVENFQNNTVLVSTSIIETLGLHVIEAIQNGVLVIVPNERYSLDVYGSDTLTYEIFNHDTLVKVIKDLKFQNSDKIRKIVRKNQNFLKNSEKSKLQNIVEVFNVILKKRYNNRNLSE